MASSQPTVSALLTAASASLTAAVALLNQAPAAAAPGGEPMVLEPPHFLAPATFVYTPRPPPLPAPAFAPAAAPGGTPMDIEQSHAMDLE